MTDKAADSVAAKQTTYLDFSPDFPDLYRISPIRPQAEARHVLKHVRLEMWRCLEHLHDRGTTVDQITSYRYEADASLEWKVTDNQSGNNHAWVTVPVQHSLHINWALKNRLLDPVAFLRIAVTEWDEKLVKPAKSFLPFFYTQKEVPDKFTPLALTSVQEDGVREDLRSLWRAFQGATTEFQEVGTLGQDLSVVYQRAGGEAVELCRRYEYPWLYQYLRDNPQHADELVKILNLEAEEMSKDMPFEWQIYLIEIPKPAGEYIPVTLESASN